MVDLVRPLKKNGLLQISDQLVGSRSTRVNSLTSDQDAGILAQLSAVGSSSYYRSPLSTKLVNRMSEGLVGAEFNPELLRKAVSSLKESAINSADDFSHDRHHAVFRVADGAEPPPIAAIETLVLALEDVSEKRDPDFRAVEDAYNILFKPDPAEQKVMTAGQALIKSLSEIALKKMQVTIEFQAYVHQWQALEAFLKALQ